MAKVFILPNVLIFLSFCPEGNKMPEKEKVSMMDDAQPC